MRARAYVYVYNYELTSDSTCSGTIGPLALSIRDCISPVDSVVNCVAESMGAC